jgi:acetolactate synthase I/III small subunit
MSTHTLSLMVENRHGALSRIANLFSSRGYNIGSLTVAETDDPTVARMTIVVAGDEDVIEQVIKQLNRLIDVIKVVDFVEEPVLSRELALVTVDATRATRHEISQLGVMFGAKVASVAPSSVTLELTSTSETIDEFVTMVKPYGLKELVRSGKVALAKARK